MENNKEAFKAGDKQKAKIVSIKNFGAFAEIGPGVEGMIHISEFSPSRTEDINSILSVGDVVPTIVKEIRRDGKISLSVKDVDPEFFDGKMDSNQKGGNSDNRRGGGMRR